MDRSTFIKEGLDDDQLRLVEKVWAGELGNDNEYDKNVEDLYSLVGEDVLRDTFMI